MVETHEHIDRNELSRYRRRDMVPQGVQSGDLLGYEHGDANIRAIINSVLIIFGSVLVIMFLAAATFFYYDRRETALKDKMPMGSPLFMQQQIPPSPHLLPSQLSGANLLPWDSMIRERAVAEDDVNKPADKAAGTIPIADAMATIARENGDTTAKGLPAHSTLTAKSPLYPPNANFESDDAKQNVEASAGRTLESPEAKAPQDFPRTTNATP